MARLTIGLFAFLLLLVAVLPIFGLNLVLFMNPRLEPFEAHTTTLYLFVNRSAAYASIAFFALNYLRHKRPLSSVSPLLVFSNSCLIFGPIYILMAPEFYWGQLAPLPLLVGLSVFFFRQNQNESKKIFVDHW